MPELHDLLFELQAHSLTVVFTAIVGARAPLFTQTGCGQVTQLCELSRVLQVDILRNERVNDDCSEQQYTWPSGRTIAKATVVHS